MSETCPVARRKKRKDATLLAIRGGAMTAVPISPETYLPDADNDVARVYDFLAAHEQAGRGTPEPRYFLAGPTPGEQVELPHEAYRVLRQVIEAMRQGLAVTVVPQSQTLTTQQAADLLGISRPTVIKLLDDGKIPLGYSSDWTNPGQRLAMACPPAAGPGWAGGPARSAGSAPSSFGSGWGPGRGIAPGRGRRRAQAPGRTAAPGCATGGG